MSNQTTYEIVTQRIIDCLENGVAPWRKGWSVESPRNAISGRKYSGINTLVLSLSTYTDPRWATIRQINQLGGRVRKGEHSTAIAFWKRIPITADEGEIEKVIPYLRFYRVFNVQQTDLNLPALNTRGLEPIAEAERVISKMPKRPSITHNGGDRAFYMPTTDSIHMPAKGSLHSNEDYYVTLLHEMSHSTGHSSRLNRHGLETGIAPFGSETYSKEELVPEISAAFLASECGIKFDLPNSVAYVGSWLRVLRNDRKMVIVAAGQAQRAADFILNRQTQETDQGE